MSTLKNKIHIVFIGILFLAISLLFFVSSKGFNYVDEGFYALISNPDQNVNYTPINIDIFFKYIYQFSGYHFDLRGLRLFRIIFVFVGSVVMFFGIKQISLKFGFHFHENKILFSFVVLLGFLSSYNLSYQTPGYNEYSILGIQLFAGFLTFVFLNEKLHFVSKIGLYFSSMIGFFILYLSKPTGLPFLFVYSIILLLIANRKSGIVEILIFWFFIVIILLAIPTESRFSIWSLKRVLLIFKASSVNHSFINIAFNLVKGIFLFIVTFLFSYFFSVKGTFNSYKYWLRVFAAPLFIFGTVFLLKWNNSKDVNIFDFIVEYMNHAASLVFAFLLGMLFKKHNIDKKGLILFVLASTLFMASFFGTDGSLLISIPKSFQFFLIAFLPFSGKRNFLLAILLTLLLFLKMILTILFPFEQESLLRQTKLFSYGKSLQSVLFLDSLNYKNQMEFNNAISSYPNIPIIGFDRMQSFIYLSGSYYPGSMVWGNEDLKDYFNYRFNNPDKFILAVRNRQMFKLVPYLNRYRIKEYLRVAIHTNNTRTDTLFFSILDKYMN